MELSKEREREICDSERAGTTFPFMEEQGSIFNIYFLNLYFGILWKRFLLCQIGSWESFRSCRVNHWSVYLHHQGELLLLCVPQQCLPQSFTCHHSVGILRQWLFSSQSPGPIPCLSSLRCSRVLHWHEEGRAGETKIVQIKMGKGVWWTWRMVGRAWHEQRRLGKALSFRNSRIS